MDISSLHRIFHRRRPYLVGLLSIGLALVLSAHGRHIRAKSGDSRPQFLLDSSGAGQKIWTNFRTEEGLALPAPPNSVHRFPLEPGPRRLTFKIGVAREPRERSGRSASGMGRGVLFRVLLERGSRRKPIFWRYLEAPPADAARGETMSEEIVPLPERPAKVNLVFETRGEEGLSSFWIDPVVDSPRPNPRRIILISLDTLRADHLGSYGYGRPTSPALDALARDGATFLQAYAPSPWTLPSHMSLFTGLDPDRHGVQGERNRLDPDRPTIPALLRAERFSTAAFTDGGFLGPEFGFSRGFGLYQVSAGSPRPKDAAARTAALARAWLGRHADRDFFLFLHSFQIHDPYAPPEARAGDFLARDARWRGLFLHEYLGGFKGYYRGFNPAERANIIDLYDAGIRYADEALIKSLVEDLKTSGLYDETMIIVTSDHGEQFAEHGAWGHMSDLYQEVLRIPLIVKFPRGRFASRRISDPVRLTDVPATITEAFDLRTSGLDLDGASLLPILEGAAIEPRTVLASIAGNVNEGHFRKKSAIVEEGRYKLIVNGPRIAGDSSYFLDRPPDYPPFELYDLSIDPEERQNLAARLPELTREMKARLGVYSARARTGMEFRFETGSRTREKIQSLGYAR